MSKQLFEVIWSPQAELHYSDILKHIINEWSSIEAIEFDLKAMSLVEKLKTHQNLCPKAKKYNLRKCVITPQTSLVYRIKSPFIELVDFIDNRTLHPY